MSEEKIETREDRIKKVLKEEAALEDSFKEIFPKYNDFKMPVNVAWIIFGNIIRDKGISITSSDTEKMISLFVDVRKEYYGKERNMIIDEYGYPNVEASLSEDIRFLEKNPDIGRVIANRTIDETVKEILEKKSVDVFLEKMLSYAYEEKEYFIGQLERYYYEKHLDDGVKKSLDVMERLINGEHLSEEEQKPLYNIAAIRRLKKNNVKDENGELDELKTLACLAYYGDEKEKMFAVIRLEKYMGEDAKLLLVNDDSQENQRQGALGKFYGILLRNINARKEGSYESIYKVLKEHTKTLEDEEYPSMKEDYKDELKELQEEKDKIILKMSKEEIALEEKHIEDSLNGDLEKNIYANLKNLDFSQGENALMLIQLYKDVSKMKPRNPERKDRKNALENVLEAMIFAKKNAGKFGNYLDFKDGKFELDDEKVNKDIKNVSEEYSELLSYTKSFVREKLKSPSQEKEQLYGDNSQEDKKKSKKSFDLYTFFQDMQKELANSLNRRKLLEEYIKKRGDFETIGGSPEIEFDILEIERKLSKLREYSTFFSNGRINFSEIKKYYGQIYQNPENVEDNKEMEKIIVEFAKFDDQNTVKKLGTDARRALLEENSDEEYEMYNAKYKEAIKKYATRYAIEDLYAGYLNGKDIDKMKEIEKVHYIESMGYLYHSEDPKLRQLAEAFIKYNFPNIKVNENGDVDEKAFRNLYNSFHERTNKKSLDNVEDSYERYMKSLIAKYEKCNLSKIDFEINVKKIEETLRGSRKEFLRDENLYNTSELEVIKKLRTCVDLNRPEDAQTIIGMLTSIRVEYRENKNISPENQLLESALRKFIRSSENRGYFSEFLNDSELKHHVVSQINEDIVETLGFKGKIITREELLEAQRREAEKNILEEFSDSKLVLNTVLNYDGDINELKRVLGKFQILDSKYFNLFKTNGEISVERIEKFVGAVTRISRLANDRDRFVESMSNLLVEAAEDYYDNFDELVKYSEMTMAVIVGGSQARVEEIETIKLEKEEEESISDEEYIAMWLCKETNREADWEEYLVYRKENRNGFREFFETRFPEEYPKIQEQIEENQETILRQREEYQQDLEERRLQEEAEKIQSPIAENVMSSVMQVKGTEMEVGDGRANYQESTTVVMAEGRTDADTRQISEGEMGVFAGKNYENMNVSPNVVNMQNESREAVQNESITVSEITLDEQNENKVQQSKNALKRENEETPEVLKNTEKESQEKQEDKSFIETIKDTVASLYKNIMGKIKGIRYLTEGKEEQLKKDDDAQYNDAARGSVFGLTDEQKKLINEKNAEIANKFKERNNGDSKKGQGQGKNAREEEEEARTG